MGPYSFRACSFYVQPLQLALNLSLIDKPLRRGGRAVEGARLESGYTVTGIVSSNLILSAIYTSREIQRNLVLSFFINKTRRFRPIGLLWIHCKPEKLSI